MKNYYEQLKEKINLNLKEDKQELKKMKDGKITLKSFFNKTDQIINNLEKDILNVNYY